MNAATLPEDEQARRAEFYARIGQRSMTPLWEVLGALVPPQPRSPARPAHWCSMARAPTPRSTANARRCGAATSSSRRPGPGTTTGTWVASRWSGSMAWTSPSSGFSTPDSPNAASRPRSRPCARKAMPWPATARTCCRWTTNPGRRTRHASSSIPSARPAGHSPASRRDIPIAQALEHVYGYAVGLDMTRRDLQLEARDKGRPWEFGKSFAKSAPIGPLHRAQDIGHPASAAISLTVNGQPRQSSDIAKLIWSVSECIAYLSQYDALEPGDIIMTGTPEGVNAVVAGDVMHGEIQGLTPIDMRVAA